MTKKLIDLAQNDIPVLLTLCSSQNELIDVLNDFIRRHSFAFLSILEADMTLKYVHQLMTIPRKTILHLHEDLAFTFFSKETSQFTRTAHRKSFTSISLPVFKNEMTVHSFYIVPFAQNDKTILLLAIAHQKRRGIDKFGVNALNYFSSALFATLNRLMQKDKLSNFFESTETLAHFIDITRFPGGIISSFDNIFESFKKILNDEPKAIALWFYNKTQIGEELVLQYTTIPIHEWTHTYIGVNDSCTGVAIKELKTKYFENVQDVKLFKNPKIASNYGLKQLLAVPLVTSENEVHAAINIYPSDAFKPDPEILRMIDLHVISVARAFEFIEMKDKLTTLNNVISFHKKAEPFTSLDKFFKTLVFKLRDPKILGVQGASVFFTLGDRSDLSLYATTGLEKPNKIGDIIYRYGEGLTGRVAKTGKTIIIHNLSNEKGLQKGKAVESTIDPGKTWMGAPIKDINTGKVLGVIRCVNKIGREHNPFAGFSFFDQQVLEFIAFFSSMVIKYIKMIEDKEETLRFQGEFINSLSHEIDSPITGILGRTGLISDFWKHKNIPQEKKNLWIQDIENECELIDFLVRRYSLKAPHYEKINIVKEVVIAVKYLLSPFAQSKYIEIIHEIEEEIPDVIVDVNRFKQVIYNLIINAIKYSRRNTCITISVRNYKSSIVIEVSSFGIGIKGGWEKKIFQEYVRAPGAKRFHPSGTGRGLYTCKTIVVDEHGGEISLEQRENPTIFKILIPSHRVCLSRG